MEKPEETELPVELFPKAILTYPAIYEGREWEGKGIRYGAGFTTDDPAALEQLTANGIIARRGVFNTNGRFKPVVTEHSGDYPALKRAFDIADIRNIKRDRLFVNIEAYLHLRVFAYDYQGLKGKGIVLLGISIDAAPLEAIALNITS